MLLVTYPIIRDTYSICLQFNHITGVETGCVCVS